ncbi:hypothetical protein PMPD1_2805 [Paramixta manurensis]|uniref:Four-carbon acid sugar kinase family protein n=1 Tax=Paramixta manurensis TaxID=2740817 RepID=A0A6M8ULJ0_9GAMM|nr:hypothetical protein PMPD1_2805 [Erwiniaceae bacterium PD-1]
MKMLVIADDFTGANDTGVQLAKKGARTEVVLDTHVPAAARADVLVVNTESRALSSEAARARVAQVVEACGKSDSAPLQIYKKIDSTLRGNIGAEVETALNLSGARLAIVAAAIPSAGRTTVNGECLVHGVALAETEFATDPKTPILSSRIKTLLGQQTDLPVYELDLENIRHGDLTARLASCAEEARAIVVLDAESDSDLARIARAVMRLELPYVLVGAAGLANALPVNFYRAAPQQLPVLAVAGSMSEATRKQIAFAAREKSLTIIDVDIDALLQPAGIAAMMQDIGMAVEVLNQQRHCVLRTCRDEQARLGIDSLCQRYHMTRQELGETIGHRLGEMTRQILGRARVGGLFLTGGDIAIAVARALGAQGYRITHEVTPCVPCGTFINSDIDDLPVITKAGGFGDESTLRDALYFIEEMYSDK